MYDNVVQAWHLNIGNASYCAARSNVILSLNHSSRADKPRIMKAADSFTQKQTMLEQYNVTQLTDFGLLNTCGAHHSDSFELLQGAVVTWRL